MVSSFNAVNLRVYICGLYHQQSFQWCIVLVNDNAVKSELQTGLTSKPKPGPSPKSQARTLSETNIFFEARVTPENHIYRGSQALLNCGGSENVEYGYSSRYTVYHTKNSIHLEQNVIGSNKYRLSLLVNDDTAECNVSQEKN